MRRTQRRGMGGRKGMGGAMHCWWIRAITWTGTVLCAAEVSAAEAAPESLRVREGRECFLREDYECARAAFAEAHQTDRSAATVLKLGLAELNSGHPVQAAEHLREYLSHDEEPPRNLDAVRSKWLPRAEAQTARLEVTAPSAAEIAVDGQVVAKGDASMVVAQGPHDVAARQGDFQEVVHVVARGGELVEAHFQRVADAPPMASPASGASAGSHQESPTSTLAPKWRTVIALGAGALAATGVAAGFGVAAQGEPGGSRARIVDNDVALVGLLAAGVLAGGTLGTWLLWRSDSKRTGVRMVPMTEAHVAGVTVGGTW